MIKTKQSIRLPNAEQLTKIRSDMARMFWVEQTLMNHRDGEISFKGATMRVFDYWRVLFFRDLTIEYILNT